MVACPLLEPPFKAYDAAEHVVELRAIGVTPMWRGTRPGGAQVLMAHHTGCALRRKRCAVILIATAT